VTHSQPTSGTDSKAPHAASRLQQWLANHGFTAAQLQKQIGMSRQSLQQIREGRDVRMTTARRILAGCRKLAQREVRMEEIFDLDPHGRDR
jgi:DNA-binding XRE family transcriptional regulator